MKTAATPEDASSPLEMDAVLNDLYTQVYICPTDTETLYYYKDGVYVPAKPYLWEILERNHKHKLTRIFVSEVYAHLQRANTVDRQQINKYEGRIPLKNGMYNFASKRLELFYPQQRFTFMLDVEYQEEADCPKWLEFVSQIVDPDAVPLLQEIMGYCLLPAMPYHKMFWLYGTGRNGKGVVIRTIEAILGKDNCGSLNLSEFREARRFSLCQLYAKLMNVSSEPQLSKYGLPTNIIKMVTGEDTIHAEIKGKNQRLTFTNYSKLLVLGNHFPKVEDNSLGWWDRVIALKFPNSFTGDKQVANIENRWLPSEASGVFNWMLQGLNRIFENNGFSTSKTTEETKAEFMKVSDPFNAWIIECCIKLPQAYISREDALEDYNDYCDDLGADRDGKKVFYEKLRNEPRIKDTSKKIAGKTVRVFEGLTLKTEEPEQTVLEP